MARNKYPEETVNLILDTATRLFVQKGYERTSIQDIINNLGGLSKGAIYHHFKSKEEILIAVTNKMTEESNRMLFEIRNNPNMTGKEKLKKLLEDSINRPVHDEIFSAAPNIKSSPALVSSILMGNRRPRICPANNKAGYRGRLHSDRISRRTCGAYYACRKRMARPYGIRRRSRKDIQEMRYVR